VNAGRWASMSTGLRDAVGIGGVLVPARDMAALRAATAQLLDDPQRRAEAGRRDARLSSRSFLGCDRQATREIYAAVV